MSDELIKEILKIENIDAWIEFFKALEKLEEELKKEQCFP